MALMDIRLRMGFDMLQCEFMGRTVKPAWTDRTRDIGGARELKNLKMGYQQL